MRIGQPLGRGQGGLTWCSADRLSSTVNRPSCLHSVQTMILVHTFRKERFLSEAKAQLRYPGREIRVAERPAPGHAVCSWTERGTGCIPAQRM